MPLYYVQVVYQKNQLGTRLDKDRDDSRSKLYQRKSKRSERQRNWRIGSCSEPLSRGFRGQSPLRKCLASKELLDWL